MYAMNQGGATAVQAQSMIEAFDYCWKSTVTNYTECKITKHTDKLIAISSVARQLASTQILQTANIRYLAGFWDINLLSQLAWITVVGSTTTPRKWSSEEEYSAPRVGVGLLSRLRCSRDPFSHIPHMKSHLRMF
jgi:hypothetical protein